MKTSDVAMFVAAAALGLGASESVVDLSQTHDLKRLRARVSCLEHPHAESSIAATRINGRFVITQPAHRTGCP